MRYFTEVRAVPAPVVESSRRGPRLVFKPYRLPVGFDMRDHAARVREFGRAFVTSVTGSVEDYRTAARSVVERFGGGGTLPEPTYPDGGAVLPKRPESPSPHPPPGGEGTRGGGG